MPKAWADMAVKNKVLAIPLTNVASSTLGASYLPINATGLANPCFLIRITNASNKDVTISYDGVNDHEYLVSATFMDINAQTNSQPNTNIANFATGTVVYVKGTAGTGIIYLSGYYQPTQ